MGADQAVLDGRPRTIVDPRYDCTSAGGLSRIGCVILTLEACCGLLGARKAANEVLGMCCMWRRDGVRDVIVKQSRRMATF